MKQIDLGYGAVALEPSDATDRVDGIPDDVLRRHNVSPTVERLYKEYRSHVREAEAERRNMPASSGAASGD